ncbi:MAG: hypothetical protein JNL30_00935 [Rubrivivax sp.]|nr:hypothetical protein [Rubrivivax sp.]
MVDVCIRADVCNALLGTDTSEIELLPFTIEGAPWVLVNCLRTVEVFDPSTTDIGFLEVAGHGPVPTEVRWINVTDPTACSKALFGLRSPKVRQLLWTDDLVNRCRELGLQGLEFKHVGFVVPDAAHAVPKPAAAPPVASLRKYKGPKLTTTPLPADEMKELEAAGTELRRKMDLPHEAGAELVLASVSSELSSLGTQWSGLGKDQRVDALLGLSSVFGDLLRSALGWSWVQLRQGRSQRWIALLAPSGQHAFAPVPYFHLQMGSEAPTVTLLFNLLATGPLPPAEPGQIVPIG